MRYWLAAIVALGFLNLSELAKADVYYWSFFGGGSCGSGPACVGPGIIATATYEGLGSLTLGSSDGPGFDVISFTGEFYALGGGRAFDYHITSGVSLAGAPLIFDPSASNGTFYPNGLVIPDVVTCYPSAFLCSVSNLLGANIIGFGNFDFSETPLTIPPVPESSTWVMLLIGFAGIGFAGYRRKKGALSFA